MKGLCVLLALSAVVTTSCASPVSGLSPVETSATPGYQLGPGDEIRLTVIGFDSLNNTYTVGDTGSISIPMLSSVEVSGHSPQELEGLLASMLVRKELALNPSVSVQVLKYRPFFILGEVQKPGQYPFVPGMTVLTAVSIAGGYTFRADKKASAISRRVKGTNLTGKATQQSSVQPGDTIYVHEAWF